MKEVMIRAWEIAREGVKKFGGKVKEYIAEALRIAWKEFKMTVGNERGQLKVGMKINGWADNDDYWEEVDQYTYKRLEVESFLKLNIGKSKVVNYQDEDGEVITIADVKIAKETEKATLLSIDFTTQDIWDGEIEDEYSGEWSAWLPKSQIEIHADHIIIPKWLAKKKEVVKYGEKFSVVKEVN